MLSTCVLATRVHVAGTRAAMTVTNMMLPQLLFHRLSVRGPEGVRRETFTKRATYAYQLEAFVATVRGVPAISSTAASGVRNMEVIDAIYRAAGLRPRGMP